MNIKLVVKEPTSPLHSSIGADLKMLEERIRQGHEHDIELRWAFGKRLVDKRRDKKKLPDGLLAAIVKEMGVSRAEVKRRMAFAEKTADKKVLAQTLSQFKTWNQIVTKFLPSAPKTKKKAHAHNVIRYALRFKQWEKQIGRIDPKALTARDVKELDKLAALVRALQAKIAEAEAPEHEVKHAINA